MFFFFFSSRRRHTRFSRDWSSDVCSSDLVRHAATVQNWSTALKVGAILALAVAGFALGDGFHHPDTRAFTTPLSLTSLSAAGVALLGVLWAYEGWQNVTNSAGEARDPQRTFARGIGC